MEHAVGERGLLLADGGQQPTAAAAALRVLAEARADPSVADADLVARHPVLLSLLPPSIGGDLRLPPPPASLPAVPAAAGREAAVRESLRLRARWVQELTSRRLVEIGRVTTT